MAGSDDYFRLLARRLEAADGTTVEYGVRDEPHSSGMSAQQLAEILRAGTRDGRIPARDFMQVAADELEVLARPRLKAIARKLLKGESPRREVDKLVGVAEEAVVRAIDTFHTPANATATIAAKGRDDPLVDGGDLRDAAGAWVAGDE